jgi:RND family efflux transporter MFP subunit
MQIAAPFGRPVRRFFPLGNLGPSRKLALLLLGLIVLAVAGFFAWQRATSQQGQEPVGQVVPVRRGNVAATVSATGSVVATRQARLSFNASGRVKDVLVNVGDQVKAGQALATLASESAQVKLDTARSQLVSAQLKLQQLTEAATADDLAAAQAAYDAALAKLDDLQAGAKPADLEAAQAGVVSAQAGLADANAKLQTLTTGATPQDRAAAEAALIGAQNTLAAAQSKLDQLDAGPTNVDSLAARTAVDDANSSLHSAQARLDELRAGATQSDLATAQSAFDQAQASLTTAKAKLDQTRATASLSPDVVAAQASLADAELALHSKHEALDQLSAQLEQANATVASQDVALSSAIKTADQTCDRLGDSSAECASAKAHTDSLQPDILKAQQQVKLLNGDGAWDQLAAQKDVVAAQAAYDSAAAKLKQVQAAQSVPVDLISAQSSYDAAVSSFTSARAKLDQVKSGATAADLAAADATYSQAQSTLKNAQAKLDQLLQGPTDADRVAAETAVGTAQANVQASQSKLDTLGQATPQDVQSARMAKTSAEAGLASAQAKLDQLQAGPTQADIVAARSAIATAQAALVGKSGQARPSDVALQQEAVRQAELAVQQAQLDLDSNTLYAPFDGTVASVAGSPGEPAQSSSGTGSSGSSSSTGGFITLVDPHEVRVDVTVDETDVARVAVGKPVTITFDALPNRPFRGKVLSISPTGTLSQGVVTYPVSVSIDTRNQMLPAGMTASTTITVDEKDDVLLVPNRAVRRQGREQVVEVMGEDGKPVSRVVHTGVQNDQVVEVTDGVGEGEQVLIQATSTRAPTVGGPGGGPGPGAGPGQRVVFGR